MKIAVYNYLDTTQQIQVELQRDPWFELLDSNTTTITVKGGDIGSAEFRIRPKTIGTQLLKVSARSSEAADAVIKSMIVEPEGVGRETVENVVVPAGQSRTLSLPLPDSLQVVPDSQRAYVSVTGSLLAQTIQGLDQLLQILPDGRVRFRHALAGAPNPRLRTPRKSARRDLTSCPPAPTKRRPPAESSRESR